jgi:hypothetical protein
MRFSVGFDSARAKQSIRAAAESPWQRAIRAARARRGHSDLCLITGMSAHAERGGRLSSRVRGIPAGAPRPVVALSGASAGERRGA